MLFEQISVSKIVLESYGLGIGALRIRHSRVRSNDGYETAAPKVLSRRVHQNWTANAHVRM